MEQTLYLKMDPADYQLNGKHLKTCAVFTQRLRDLLDLEVPEESRLFSPSSFGIFSLFEKDVLEFYYNDVCMNCAKLDVMFRHRDFYKEKAIGSQYDLAVRNILCCWEYLFQILNQFWGVELLSTAHMREELAELYRHKWELVKTLEGYQIVSMDYSQRELAQINEHLKQAMPVLHVQSFRKYIKKEGKLTLCKELDDLMNLYNHESCRALRRVRNIQTHAASSSFILAIGSRGGPLPVDGFTKQPLEDRVQPKLALDNVSLLAKSLAIFHKIIWLQKVPNTTQNAASSFFGVQLACSDCGFRDSMVQEVFDILAGQIGQNGFFCPNCQKALRVKQAVPMNEVDYNSLLFHPQKFSEQLDRYVRPQEQTDLQD